jgi:hypothetical protein
MPNVERISRALLVLEVRSRLWTGAVLLPKELPDRLLVFEKYSTGSTDFPGIHGREPVLQVLAVEQPRERHTRSGSCVLLNKKGCQRLA